MVHQKQENPPRTMINDDDSSFQPQLYLDNNFLGLGLLGVDGLLSCIVFGGVVFTAASVALRTWGATFCYRFFVTFNQLAVLLQATTP
eukprot:scaffold294_cov221-Amphora_coffeaeformis.AAC.52